MNKYIQNLNYNAPTSGFEKARKLRRQMTESEKILWQELRNRKLAGCKFRRQHPIGRYIADLYCHELRLVIELDGAHHFLPDQKQQDDERSFTMNLDEIHVLRFKNIEVASNLHNVLDKINAEIVSLRPELSS